jgi:hypothetical protein
VKLMGQLDQPNEEDQLQASCLLLLVKLVLVGLPRALRGLLLLPPGDGDDELHRPAADLGKCKMLLAEGSSGAATC